jgi:thiamine-phosphate pyrophosphorylase
MRARQTIPRQWLVTDERLNRQLLALVARLPRGSGILFRHHGLARGERQRLYTRLRPSARSRSLLLVDEAKGRTARVHDPVEIRQARLRGAQLLFVSPLFGTRTHPEMQPLPRMRAAALVRLAGRNAIALGGMDARRFRLVRRLGFQGWAGIDAWLARIRT